MRPVICSRILASVAVAGVCSGLLACGEGEGDRDLLIRCIDTPRVLVGKLGAALAPGYRPAGAGSSLQLELDHDPPDALKPDDAKPWVVAMPVKADGSPITTITFLVSDVAWRTGTGAIVPMDDVSAVAAPGIQSPADSDVGDYVVKMRKLTPYGDAQGCAMSDLRTPGPG